MAEHPSLHVLLRRAVREFEKLEARMLERSGARLRPGAVPLLAALLDASPLTATELCGQCEVEPSTMTGLLRTLESNDLITRSKVVLDQRRQAISLTPRGRAAARVALRARTRAEEAVLAGLPRATSDALKAGILEAVVEAARATGPSTEPRRRR
jgi:DNA-binding MarR family transcriptional regulator